VAWRQQALAAESEAGTGTRGGNESREGVQEKGLV